MNEIEMFVFRMLMGVLFILGIQKCWKWLDKVDKHE